MAHSRASETPSFTVPLCTHPLSCTFTFTIPFTVVSPLLSPSHAPSLLPSCAPLAFAVAPFTILCTVLFAVSCTVPFAISCTVAFAISCTVTFTVVHLVLNLRFPLSLLHCHAPLFHWRTPPLSPSYTFAFTAPSHCCTLLLDLNSQPSHAMPLHMMAFAQLPATIHKPTAIHKLDSHQASSS